MMPTTPEKALDLLKALGAPGHLVRHHELVLEAATELLDGLRGVLRHGIDRQYVLVGAALHDSGKILHPEEMHGTGSQHEADGKELLLRNGVDERVARVCVTHADWSGAGVSLEERLVALADKLWKGKRVAALEEQVIREIGERAEVDFWAAFVELDAVFEAVAARGDERLHRSARE